MNPPVDNPGPDYREVRLLLAMMGASVPVMARAIGENVNSVYDALKRDFQGPIYRRIRDKAEAYLSTARERLGERLGSRQPPLKTMVILGAGTPGLGLELELRDLDAEIHLADTAVLGPADAEHRGGDPVHGPGLGWRIGVGSEIIRGAGQASQITLHLTRPAGRGRGGPFQVELLTHPAPIDPRLCRACGACAQACPEQCIASPAAEQTPPYYTIHRHACRRQTGGACQACLDACVNHAIDFGRPTAATTLDADALLICAGPKPPLDLSRNLFTPIQDSKIQNSEGGPA